MLDDGHLPPYVKLYEALVSLQKEIEQSLPEFQEMILGLQKHDAAAALGTADQDEICMLWIDVWHSLAGYHQSQDPN